MKKFKDLDKIMEKVKTNKRYNRECRYWLRLMNKRWQLNSIETNIIKARIAEYYAMGYADWKPKGKVNFQNPIVAKYSTMSYFDVDGSPFVHKILVTMNKICENNVTAKLMLYKNIELVNGIIVYNLGE